MRAVVGGWAAGGVVAVVGAVAGVMATGCDLVAGIGEYCEVGVDPGCGTTGSGATGGTAGTGGTMSTGGTGGAGVCTPAETKSCYGGPDMTAGVGICKAGTETCKEDGSGFGVCEGEQVPGKETCASTDDEDCDGRECAYWSASFGTALEQKSSGVGIDSEGNVFLAGYSKQDAVSFGDITLTGTYPFDAFLVKLDPAGKPLWGKVVAPTKGAIMVVDPQGGVVLASSFTGSFTVGTVTLTAKSTIATYVMKFTKDGDLLWARAFCEAGLCYPRALAIDGFGDVVLGGYFDQTIDFDTFGDPPYQSGGGLDAYVVKLAGATGAEAWSHALGDPVSKDEMVGVSVDTNNNVVVTGKFETSITLDGTTHTNPTPATRDVFVAKFDQSGNWLWGEPFAVESSATVAPTALADNSIILHGSFIDTINWDGSDLSAVGGADIVVMKLDEAGVPLWSHAFGGGSSELPSGLVADASGAFTLGVVTDGAIGFGGETLSSAGFDDLFLARFDAGGNHVWSRRFGSSNGAESGLVFAADWASGDLALAATITSPLDFGAGGVEVFGSSDFVVAKLAP